MKGHNSSTKIEYSVFLSDEWYKGYDILMILIGVNSSNYKDILENDICNAIYYDDYYETLRKIEQKFNGRKTKRALEPSGTSGSLDSNDDFHKYNYTRNC